MIIQNGPPSLWLPVTTGGFLTQTPPSPPPPPVPLIFQASEVKREAGVERQTRDTGEGALRKFLSKKRDESEKFSDSEVCDKIKRLANWTHW